MKRIESMVTEFIAPLLKKNGFKKKKQIWNRERNNFIDVIEIEELHGSTNDNERFVINIGIFVPSFFKTVWENEYRDFAQDVDALLRLRLEDFCSDFFSEKLNKSWIDLNTDDISNIGTELAKLFEREILPYLDRINDYKALEKYFNSSNSRHKEYLLSRILYALLKYQVGCLDEAKNILESLTTGRNKAWSDKAKEILSRI